MSTERPLPVGRVGRAHGLDGAFYLERPSAPLSAGARVRVAGDELVVERVGGAPERPLLRLSGVEDRDAAERLRGEPVVALDGRLDDGEYLVDELVGCTVPGLGEVRRVIAAPSCDLLEVGDDELLVPLVGDAVRHVDVDARVIEVDRRFLGL